jgi:hypothetical protein
LTSSIESAWRTPCPPYGVVEGSRVLICICTTIQCKKQKAWWVSTSAHSSCPIATLTTQLRASRGRIGTRVSAAPCHSEAQSPSTNIRGLHMHSWLLALQSVCVCVCGAGLYFSLRLFLHTGRRHVSSRSWRWMCWSWSSQGGLGRPLLYVVAPLLVALEPTLKSEDSAPFRDLILNTGLLRPECSLSPDPADR